MKEINLRIGHGFDVHRFDEEFDARKPLKLAGIVLPEPRSLVAHSDGDLLLHAVCDAILGAIAAGDIGLHFPESDAAYANADSSELLRQVLDLASARHFKLVNVDVTVVAQVPRLAPHVPEMTLNLASLLKLPSERVNIKATTTERMGYIGREEGIACYAVVLMNSDV